MRRIVVVVVPSLLSVWPSGERAMAVQAAPARSLQADFNNDGAADLSIGVPFEWVGPIQNAGAVNVLYGSAGGLQGPGSQFFTRTPLGFPALLTRRTASAVGWRPATSTVTALLIWPSASPARTSAPCATQAG